MKKTGGIIATIVACLLCGCPGLVAIGLGVFVAVGNQLPQAAQNVISTQNVITTTLLLLCPGLVFITIPVVVGILTLRNKRTPTPVQDAPVPQADAAPVQPAYVPSPAPQPVSPPPPVQPAPQPAVADPTQELYARLMALNRPTAPYRIVDGSSENVDLIAEWKIVDAQWYEIFAKANLTKVFRIYLKLDPARRELRAMDREYTLQWRAGVPSLSVEASFFKGQKSSISFGTGYAFTETLAPGQVYKYKFNTNELKKPIQDAVAACGWTYKGVAFGKL